MRCIAANLAYIDSIDRSEPCRDFRMPLGENLEFLRRLPKVTARLGDLGHPSVCRLVQLTEFGANPGGLRLFSFVPGKLQNDTPLVVVLHGCTQTAAGYDTGAGWSELAERYGFVLLMPEQTSSNNPNRCFNWFEPADTRRGQGEAASIRNMVTYTVREHNLDPKRVFITGLSAGGAMTSVMLSTYPEVFSAGAIIAGLAFGVANNLQEALMAMRQPPALSPREFGDFVRNASSNKERWPRIAIWHGSADHTVSPVNAEKSVQQWVDVHGLSEKPSAQDTVDGHPRRIWRNENGDAVIESYSIIGMAHGTPLGLGENGEHFGKESAFLLEVGISSSYRTASFFGLQTR